MVFSARVVPSETHHSALSEFDDAVRACFESFTGLLPDNRQWLQASLSSKRGGLGLRSLTAHSSAAFVASRLACHDLCRDLDPLHTFDSSGANSPQQASLQVTLA